MKLSTKTRYGTRALLDLALHRRGNLPVSLRDIAERQSISLNYLEHIVTPLISAGIVNSSRGAKGGLLLAKPAHEIKLKEVVELLEGSTILTHCLSSSSVCSRSTSCAIQDLWSDVNKAIDQVLSSTSLHDLVEKQRSKSGSNNMYYI